LIILLANFISFAINTKPASASPGLTLKWSTYVGASGRTQLGPLAADVDGDGKIEIVVTGGPDFVSTDGSITVLDGTNGKIKWQRTSSHIPNIGIDPHTAFDIADLNGDGILEIIVSSHNGPLVLHGNNGSVYWRRTDVPGSAVFGAVFDIDGDGYPEVFVNSGDGPYRGYDYITSLTYDGKVLHQALCWHPCWGGLTIGDANFDGRFELYQGDRSLDYNPASDPYKYGGWGLRALDAHTLTPLWNDSDILCSSQCPVLADVDKDGILDVVAAHQGTSDGGLIVLNAADGSVVTTGGKYRKSRSLGLPSHSQLTVYDIDGDGNLEAIICRDTNVKIWDLYAWKLDATLPIVCHEPPRVGDVTGDGEMDIIAVNKSAKSIHIYSYDKINKLYYEVDSVTGLSGANSFTLVQDVDGDGYNELVVSSYSANVYCYDTPAPASTPKIRSNLQFFSEYKRGAAEYVSPPGPPAPQISEPSPLDGATNVPISLSQLTFKLTDFQKDKINYTVATNPDIGSGNGINVANGKYTVPISSLHYSTTYTWTVTATDGTNTNTKTFTFTTENPPPWWNPNWKHRRTITINLGQIPAGQTDFPVLIDLTDTNLASKAQPDGDDFVFTDSNHNKLNHEIEQYNDTTGHLIAWVNVPFLSSTTDTVLYLYYGNPTCETQQNITAVWDTHYKMVLHLDEKTGTHYDSTENGNNGTPLNGAAQGVSGKIDGADTFDGVNDYIEVPHSNTLAGYTEAFTTSFWLKLNDVSRRQAILNKYDTAGNQKGWFIEYNPVDRPTRPFGFYASPDGLTYREWYASFVPTASVWYCITVVWEANTIPKFYVNGAQVPTVNTATITSIFNNAGASLHIGRSTYAAGRYLKGSLDEIRISNPARSASYILTCYNNQKDPSAFFTIGAEETFQEPEPPVISNPYPPDGATGTELNPTLSVTVTDYQADLMTVIFRTNASGTWQTIGTYHDVTDGTYTQTTANMDKYDTTYYWSVHVTDGTHWTNRTYSFTTKPIPSTWWNTDWQYRRVITIDPSKVSSDQTDFPVVIDLTDDTLPTKAQPDGDDFVFTDENNARLNHEIESYDYTTGHLIAWVNVPYVSSTTQTILYMYYGNPTCTNQENPPAVWDTSHKLVLHLSETHECRMWGMIANSLPHDVVLDHLIYDPSSLKVLGGSNRDGWGLVWYDSSDPEIRRGPLPASTDPNFDLAANEMADSGAWIGVGHVRARSSGGIPPWGNPHPFMRYKDGKWWAFSHNGNLNKDILKSLIGPAYLAANPPTYGTNWDDSNCIDSDLYELYVLKCIEANGWNVILGIAQAVTDITELDSGAANFLLTDGETLWGFRKGNTLSYYYKATSPQYSAVASQPPDPAQPGWVSLSDYNLITLTKNNPPSIITDIRQQYPLLVDSDLSNSVDSADLRTNGAGQDWYESRNDLPTLLFLDESDIGGNTGKKAGFTANSGKNAYLTQEFSSAQTGTFSVQWDIYVDSILDISQPDRAGIMLIGDDSGGTNGPNSADGERFVFLAFHKDGGATSGTADLVWMDTFDIFTPIASVNLDQWYTIKVVLNLAADTYDVYLDGVFIATVPACTAKTSVTHISFAQWNDGAGAFYVDNIFSPTADRYKLTITTEGNGSVAIDPAESSYTSGSKVELTAFPDSGWMFTMWKGDASGIQNPLIITMDGHKTITANFTEMLLVDSEFNDSPDSSDLRTNTAGQDWYESRGDVPTLLFLDETDVGGNTGKKAGFTASASGNAYLTQEFSSAQTGTFSVQWDIYVDSILDISGNPDRTGWMMIGDDSGGTYGPNYPGTERFVVMAFYKDGGGTTGTMDLVARERGAGWTAFTTIVSGLYLKQWYTIKVVCNLDTDTYDIYVDGEYEATVTSYNTKISVTHISFAQWNDGAGAFYVDNVFAPAVDRYRLTVNVVGNGYVTVNPGESTYAAGAKVDLTAIADPGFVFSGWSGDLIDHVNPITITMDSDKIVTATFIEPQYSLTINVIGSGSVAKNPDKSTYKYGESVILTASPTAGWSFLYWSGDLSSNDDTATITMDGDKVVFARFIQEGTCIDSTINGNDGLLYGGITQGVTGEIDGAYEFDGIDDYIEVPHSNTLAGFTTAFTASFWLRLDDINRRQTILNKYNTATNQKGWFIEYQNHVTYGKVLGFFASQDGATYREWYASFNPTPGVWYYITVVWEANTIPKFYINGVQVSTKNTSTIASIFNNIGVPLHIGRSTYAAGRYLKGSLDEIRISNPARSASYILTCFNNQKDPSTFYQVGLEETLPTEPMVSDPYPTDGATNIPITLTELSFNITDYQGDLMDYYVSTYPDIGGDSATGVSDGTYTVAVTGLQYQTTYTWHVNVTDGTHWTNRTFTFTTLGELLVDPELNDSVNSDDLRANSPEQDWYESRAGWSGGDPTLLFLDETDVGGNTGKKAGFKASSSGNAYLTQEFRTPQTGIFTVQWDIYVDSILDISSPDRAGIMLIGSDLDAQKGPSSVDSERFVFLAFYKDGGATSGPVDLVAMSSFSSFTTIASVNLDQWYTIKVVVNVTAGNYAIYVNGVYKATVNACTKLTSVTHISFAQWNDGAGAFYIDNVYASTEKRFTLTINIVGNGQVQKEPDQETYVQGTEVKLTAIADPGWAFAGWSGDLTGTENQTTILMNSNKTVTATFTKVANEPPVVSNPEPADGATNVPVSTSWLNFTISDADGDLMDYYVSTTPDIGGESHTGVSDGTYSLSVSNLAYGTTYKWWINVTDGTHWTNMSYTFTTETPLLVDSEFNDSVNSEDLYTNGAGQDWYDSRAQAPTLVFLDESNIGGNTGKKAGFTASTSGNVYLTQEFSSPQTGIFSVQWDIYVDSITDIGGTDATGFMMIGDDSTPTSPGPNYPTAERFVYMAFYKNGGGTSGSMELFCRQRGTDARTTIATLNMDQWYTIRVIVNVAAGNYDVYVDGAYMGTYTSRNAKTSVTHISFAQWNDGAGAFYVDNVFSPAMDRYKLTVNIEGDGSVAVNPGESTYASGSEVELTAIPDAGWEFTGWSGDLTGSVNPVNVTMDSDKNITAIFTYLNTPPEATSLSISPEYPVTTEELTGSYTYFDAEGDPENGTEIRWYRNDVLQPELNDTLSVSSSLTSKGEVWYFTVKPKDGKAYGELKTSPSVTIQNSAPSITGVEITPDPAFNTSTLTATPVGWLDADNDLEGYTYQWQKWNGATWENISGETSQTLDPQCFIKGDQIKIICTPYDGEDYGAPQEAIITISNSAPTIDSYYPVIDPTISEGQSQEFNITYSDLDNDVITTKWYLNDTSVSNDTDSYEFNATIGSVGIYNVTVVISDGSAQDAYMWTLTVVVGNTPPVALDLSISPVLPTTSDDLIGDYTYFDSNGDPEDGTEIRWYKNSILQPELNNTLVVSGSYTIKGDVWYFTVKPKDGEDFGTLETSSSVIIGNSPPSIDSFAPADTTPEVYENSILEFTHASSDLDSDPLTYSWLLNGTEQSTAQNWTYEPVFESAGTFNVTLVVSDGEEFVTQQWNVTVINVNRPPTASDLAISPTSPTTSDDLTASYIYSDPDNNVEDGTEIRWYKDGVLQPALNGTLTVSSSLTSKSEVWYFTIKPKDGIDFGELQTSSPVVIQNTPPTISNPEPSNSTTDVPVSISTLNFTISDANGDSMDYYVSTSPNIGSDSQTGVNDGAYSVSVSGLEYGTTYTWWVNVTDGTGWTNITFTFTTEQLLLVDSEFNENTDSADLRTNDAGQDWYESRAQVPTLLFLDETDVGGNNGKKAGFTASASGNAYCTQEFSSAQTGTFSVQWDIYVDSILQGSASKYRAGQMMIGSTSASYGPNRNDAVRFVFLAFYKSGGGTSGTADLVAMLDFNTQIIVASDLSLDRWYTIKVIVNVPAGTYDVYVDGEFKATVEACTALSSLTHISFAQWDDGAGAFYVDNVFAPAVEQYKLTVNVDGDGIVAVNPGESSYAVDSVVSLTPTAGSGYVFDHWELDSVPDGSDVPYLVTMDADHMVTAVFTAEANVAPAVSDPEPAEAATGVSVSISLLNFTISDADADSMDYYVSTVPDIGSDSALGVFDGTYSLSVSGLAYGTTYTWWVNVTDGTHWTNATFTFTTEQLLLVDSEFNDSVDSADLRANNATAQDWYESRGQNASLLTLDTANVGGNAGKKARLSGGTNSNTDNVYLTQEFSSQQTGVFSVQWDIYVDSIVDLSGTTPDRSGIMMIGTSNANGPNRADAVRFVFLAFYKNGGGSDGTADLVAMSAFGSFTTVASGLNLDQWYTIRVVVNVAAKTYEVYVDGVYKGSFGAVTAWAQPAITHISFAQWNDGAGTFYVDNVYSPALSGSLGVSQKSGLSNSSFGLASLLALPMALQAIRRRRRTSDK
jgi:predicted glutamine amidotransferase